MKKFLGVSLFLLPILLTGCGTTTSNTTQKSSQPSQVKVIVNVPKDQYKVGEDFSLKHTIEGGGKNILVASCKKEGESDLFRRMVAMGNVKMTGTIYECEQGAQGIGHNKKFATAGNYIYKFEVYDCSDIRSQLAIECDDVKDWDKVIPALSQLNTVYKVEKKISVTE